MEGRAGRPFLLAVIAILAIIQALFMVLAGLALVIEADDQDLLAHIDEGSDAVRAMGIVLLVFGVVELVVGVGLWRGSDIARLFVGALQVLWLISGVWQLVAYSGTYRWHGLWQIVFAALILLILFNRKSERFFTERSL